MQPVWGLLEGLLLLAGLLIKHLNCCLIVSDDTKKDFIIDSSMSSASNELDHHVSAVKSWDGFISMDIFYSTLKLLTSSKRRRKGSEQSSRNPQL